jgi:quinol monooxygenase YgiN
VSRGDAMELAIFARFHAQDGNESAVAIVLQEQVAAVSHEPGCREIHAFRSTRDPRLFWIHARWSDEAAFDTHAALPRTAAFVSRMETLIDHPFDVSRTVAIA